MDEAAEVDLTADLHQLVPGLGGFTGEGDDVHFTDADMNDPELLRELQLLMSPQSSASPESPITQTATNLLAPAKQSTKPAPMKASDLDLLTKDLMGMSVEEEVHVEVTDADMNDHSLLNELHSLTGIGGTAENGGHNPSIAESDTTQPSFITTPADGDELPLEFKLKTTDLNLLEKYIQLERVKAATKNRAGDKAGARQAFAEYKQLEKRLEALRMASLSALSSSSRSGSALAVSSIASADAIAQLLRKRIGQYKQAALHYKRQQDMGKAKEMLGISRRLEELEEQASLGIPVKQSLIPAEPVLQQLPIQQQSQAAPVLTLSPKSGSTAAGPVSRQSTGKDKPIKTASKGQLDEILNGQADNAAVVMELEKLKVLGNSSALFQAAEKQLKYQSDTCTSISAYYLKAGDKQNALVFHKYKKAFGTDLLILQQQQQRQSSSLADFELQPVSYAVEKVFLDIGLQDIQLEIIRGIGLSSKEVGSADVNAYVSWEFGWPTEGPNIGQGKGDTETKKSMDPEFNWKKVLKIDRSKVFQRFLERKKAIFDVYHYRGFLRKSISLGRATVKLDDLLNNSEIHDFFELLDPSNRRPMGGKLEIRIRLRQPLLKPQIVSKSEKWLFLSGTAALNSVEITGTPSPSPSSAPATTAVYNAKQTGIPGSVTALSSPSAGTITAKIPGQTLSPLNRTSQDSVLNSRSPSSKSLNTAASAVSPASSVSPAVNGSENLDNLKETFESVDSIISNNVLEYEERIVSTEIEVYSKRKVPVPDELSDRKQQLEIKMQLLVLQVQTGKLTMEMYMDQVKKSIAETKRTALAFKRLNDLEMAKRALARAKIMQDEVDEVERQQQQ